MDNDQMLADFHENRGNMQATLQTINDWALRAVAGTDAGILFMGGRRRRGETVVSSSARAVDAHELQINMGEGPCLDVLKAGQSTFVVGDTESDRRFPRWGPEAARLGIRSALSAVLETSEKRFGSLNIYSDQPHCFSRDDADVIEVFARQAARAIVSAEESEGLAKALDSRKLIGQAQGILMERYGLDGDRAFEYLVRASQQNNLKLRAVAEWIVENRDRPLAEVGT